MQPPARDIPAIVHALRRRVHAVHRRMRLAAAIRGGLTGLLAGCGVALLTFRTRIPILEHNPLALLPLSPALVVGVLALCAAAGAAIVAAGRVTALEAAAAIDRTAGLQDRTNSAVDFIARHQEGPLVDLQLSDASAHVVGVSPREVVRLAPPAVRRRACWALAAVALLGAFVSAGLLMPEPTDAVLQPDLAVIEAGRQLQEVAQSLREHAEDPRLQEARDLLDMLDKLADKLAEGAMSRKEVLSEVTKIQDRADDQQAQAQKELKSVKEALEQAAKELQDEALCRELADAMRKGQFEKAGKEMEKLADTLNQLDAKRMLMRKKLAKAAEKMDAAELAKLSDHLLKASEFLDAKDMKAAEYEMDMAAMELLGLKDLETLEAVLGRIKDGCLMCKLGLRSGKMMLAKGAGGGMPMNLPLRTIGSGVERKSNSPSLSAGTATDTNPYGTPSELEAGRRTENVSGEPGKEGETFVEISKVAESKETGSTAYRDVFAEYAKTALESLSFEKIPLGYRYYVRRYFESIRPTGAAPERPGDGSPDEGAAE